MAKPILKNKKCTVGLSCGGTCIEKVDQCQVVIKNKRANKALNSIVKTAGNRKGVFNEEQQTAISNIENRMKQELETELARILIQKAVDNKGADTALFKRSINNIRHSTKYDSILDEERANLSNPKDWFPVYNSAKNAVTAIIDQKLLENCAN